MWTFEDFVEQSQRATSVHKLKAFFERAMAGDGFEADWGVHTARWTMIITVLGVVLFVACVFLFIF